jgi:hypothetical protein
VVNAYPRYVEEGFQPYDPLALVRLTEEVVCRGEARKCTAFCCIGVYGGITDGVAGGCCLRCIFCWVDPSRDFPETHGEFYTPAQVPRQLIGIARRKRVPRLVVDDRGTERPTDWAAEVLFRIFNARHVARAHTLVASNARPEDLAEPCLRSRLLDVAVCHRVPNGSDGYRQGKDRTEARD